MQLRGSHHHDLDRPGELKARRHRHHRHHHSRSARWKKLGKKLLLALVVFLALWVIADMIVKRSNAPSAPESRRSAPAAAIHV